MALACRVEEPSTWGNRGSESPLNQWLFPDRMEMRAHDWTPGPSIKGGTAMEEYIGLDVSMKETAVSIRRAGERIWRGKCASDPSIIAELIRKRAPSVKRVVFETGPLSVWFYHSLRTEGLPAICIDARHAKAALDMAANKTDANDADAECRVRTSNDPAHASAD